MNKLIDGRYQQQYVLTYTLSVNRKTACIISLDTNPDKRDRVEKYHLIYKNWCSAFRRALPGTL